MLTFGCISDIDLTIRNRQIDLGEVSRVAHGSKNPVANSIQATQTLMCDDNSDEVR